MLLLLLTTWLQLSAVALTAGRRGARSADASYHAGAKELYSIDLSSHSSSLSPTTPPDAPFSVSNATFLAALVCRKGLTGKKVVLLVHGTGASGDIEWSAGPLGWLLPTAGKEGFDVCWVNLPGNALNDAQRSSEYVAWAVMHLASKSKTGKVDVIGHSQGAGVNIPWATIFWPSIQPLISNFVAIAADFHGSPGGVICKALKFPICTAAMIQQTKGSNLITAQMSLLPGGGGRALVPTTSLYTLGDEVIMGEIGPHPISVLEGAHNHALQDDDVCGPTHLMGHIFIESDPAVVSIIVKTLDNGAPIEMSSFNKIDCLAGYMTAGDMTKLIPGVIGSLGANLKGIDPAHILDGLVLDPTDKEPPLQPYVCDRGFATDCGPAFAWIP